jgi:hypothetical protein
MFADSALFLGRAVFFFRYYLRRLNRGDAEKVGDRGLRIAGDTLIIIFHPLSSKIQSLHLRFEALALSVSAVDN